MLGGRIDDDMCAKLQRLLEEGGRKHVVDDDLRADLVGELRHAGDVDHFQRRVGRALEKEDARVGPDGRTPLIDFKIFDEDSRSEGNLLYASPSSHRVENSSPRFESEERIPLPGRVWAVRFSSSEQLERDMQNYQPLIIGWVGVGIDILLFAVIRSLSNRRKQATRSAERMAELVNRLRASEAQIREKQE